MCSDLDPTGKGQVRWTVRWKPVLNALAVIFGDRFPATAIAVLGAGTCGVEVEYFPTRGAVMKLRPS